MLFLIPYIRFNSNHDIQFNILSRRFKIKHYWKLAIFHVIVNAFLIAFLDTNIIKLGCLEILSFIIHLNLNAPRCIYDLNCRILAFLF